MLACIANFTAELVQLRPLCCEARRCAIVSISNLWGENHFQKVMPLLPISLPRPLPQEKITKNKNQDTPTRDLL